MDPAQAAAEEAERLAFARRVAIEAGRSTLDYFQKSNYRIDWKADRTAVTDADRNAERLLREAIHKAYPEDGILGEEFGDEPGTSGRRWIIDPIDGTASFIRGVPLYGTLLAEEVGGQIAIGVIYLPALQECVYAARGQGAWYEKGNAPKLPARVSEVDALEQCTFVTSDGSLFARREAGQLYQELLERAQTSRTWGDCYGYLLVATGRADLMIDPQMHVWDAAAPLCVLQEAGGTFTDWSGRDVFDAGEGIATNGRLLESVLSLAAPYARRAE